MQNSYIKGCLIVISAALLLSLQPIFARYAYDDGANVWGVVLMRFLLPGLLLVILIKRPASLKIPSTLLLGALFGLISIFYYAALKYINAGLTSILLYLYPLFIFLVALSLREEALNLRKFASLCIALLGIYLSVDISANNSLIGILLAIGAALSCGAYIMGCRRILPEDGGLASSGWVMLGATLLLLIPLILGELELPNTLKGYSAGFALSTLCGLLPVSMLISGIQLMKKDTDVGILSTIEPVSTLLLAWLLLAEPLPGSSLVGACLIIIALILLLTAPPGKMRSIQKVSSIRIKKGCE